MGQKVKKTVTNGSSVVTTDYLGGFHYENNVLKFFGTSEGYVNYSALTGYNYTDHLGNIRVSYTLNQSTGNVTIYEQNHYYPFGLKHQKYGITSYQYVDDEGYYTGSNIVSRYIRNSYQYKYNGKEYQDELNLNVTAMDFRQYDNALGRFMTIDPETDAPEQLDKSAYAFAWNNPILNNDPDGRNPIKGLLKRLLKSNGDDGVKLVARTTKGTLKPVSRKHAVDILKNGGTIMKTTNGSSNKSAKKLMKEAAGNSKIVRHDGHKLKNAQGEETGKTGLDHYQKKSGDGSHVLYDNTSNGVAVGITLTTGASSNTKKTDEFTGKAVDFGAKMTNFVENIGTEIFGEKSELGKTLNEINPLNLGFSDLLKEADNILNTKSEYAK